MFYRWAAISIVLAWFLPGLAHAGETNALLRAGAYEVDVRLEIPNVINWSAAKTATICIPAAERANEPPLPVLSDNNPFADCPARNVRREGRSLTFEIVCDGLNMARARAAFTLAESRFDGRIAMVMGGKNMTMTEAQSGRRIGGCRGAGASQD